MQEKQFISKSLKETKKVAQEILALIESEDLNLVLLEGELGAGKTTFSQQVLELLGAKGPFTSPTFVIMKKYGLNSSIPLTPPPSLKLRQAGFTKEGSCKKGYLREFQAVYHLDCYRVESADVLELGWQEVIANPQNLVLVEWPERIKEVWPEERRFMRIKFEIKGEGERRIGAEF
jgi:tRNA threonylcarbamoyladenosine biosynthesis protein TsaE